MSRGRALRWGVVRALACGLAASATLVIGGEIAAPAGARSSPVPSCGWTSTSLISRTFGDRVRTVPGVWGTQIAPVLICQYIERTPKVQFGDVPLVFVRYGEAQHFKAQRGFTAVRRLGSCVTRGSCTEPGRPAWVDFSYGSIGTGPYRMRYVDGVVLRVEDGLNSIEIIVDNPDGPLPVANEVGRVEQLARRLIPKFRWS